MLEKAFKFSLLGSWPFSVFGDLPVPHLYLCSLSRLEADSLMPAVSYATG